jgi:hypothetical protein
MRARSKQLTPKWLSVSFLPVIGLMFLEYLSSLIQNASVTIFPTWHYGLMSQLRAEHPELFTEKE